MNSMLALLGLGGTEVVVIMGAILILFGAKRIPEFAKGLGQGIKEFKKASNEVTTEFHHAMNENPAQPARPAPQTPPPAAPATPTATVPKA